MTDRDEARVRKALQGAGFPADRDTLMAYAKTREAGPKTIQALQAMPNRSYDNVSDVLDAVPQEPEGRDQPGGTAR
jgi:hypothetical protein